EGREPAKIDWFPKGRILRREPIDAARLAIDLAVVVLEMLDVLLVEVSDEDRAVGGRLDVDGPKPRIATFDDRPEIAGLERRAIRLDVREHHASLERLDGEHLAAIGSGKTVGLIDDEGVAEALGLLVLHRLEEAERIRIREDAVLLESL